MKIGFTYDLKDDYYKIGFTKEQCAEFDTENTIHNLCQTIEALGYEVDRIGNIYSLTHKLVINKKWDFIFNISEGCYGTIRESQIPCLLDAYKIPYSFSSAETHAISLNKYITSELLKNTVSTPKHAIMQTTADVQNLLNTNNFEYPLIIKPNCEGSSKGINDNNIIKSSNELYDTSIKMLHKYSNGLVVEEFLSGREFTVGIIGNEKIETLGIMEIIVNVVSDTKIYSLDVKQNYSTKVSYKILEINEDINLYSKIESMCQRIYKSLNCRDLARIDIRLDKNDVPKFLEINTLPGLSKEDSDIAEICRLQGIEYLIFMKKLLDVIIKRITK
jgi:D-alanine-D-alanine ligase